jgi:hypothetical protein
MTPDSSLLSILPNLSIGVICIMALIYVTTQFLKSLKEQHETFRTEIKEREIALRTLESEVRTSIMKQLQENTKAFDRVMNHIKYEE